MIDRATQVSGPRLSVVIPHLNQPQLLARCLAALAAGTRPPDEVIVVDNGSGALPEAICAAHAGVRLLSEPTPGPGPARNAGVAAATGDILAFIDADCIPDPGWIEAIHAAFKDASAEVVGGDVRIDCADPARPTLLEAYESVYAYRMDRYIAEKGFTGTGNLAVRRTVLDTVGHFAGLDVAEDRDWGQRATRAGHDLRYVPAMRVYHPARKSFAELARKWDRHTAHDFAGFRTRPGGRVLWALRTIAVALSPPAELPRILMSDRISGPRARALAWIGLARIRFHRAAIMLKLLGGADAAALSGQWNR